MPKNLSALLRYQVINDCLRNNYHPSVNTTKSGFWTIDELADECLDRIGKRPSPRTILQDISMMKNGELGFEAPIENEYGIGYYYSNPGFSIFQSPFYTAELETFQSSLNLLSNFRGMSYHGKMAKTLKRFNRPTAVSNYYLYEPVGIIKGTNFFDNIIKAIEKNLKLEILYKPYFESIPFHLLFDPGILKEYQGRWYLIGTDDQGKIFNLAFDRIIDVIPTTFEAKINRQRILEMHRNIIGVSITEGGDIEEIEIKVENSLAPNILTQPWHTSQTLKSRNQSHHFFQMKLIVNKELIAKILSFGDDIKVVKPDSLARQVESKLQMALTNYSTHELS